MAAKTKAKEKAAVPADKDEALSTAIKLLEKQYGKGTVMRLGDNQGLNVEAISTGSLSLDIATGIGGLPRGRIVEIYGPESSGKTTLALHCVAEKKKKGGEAAFIDAEHALDPTLSMLLTLFTPQISALTLIHCSFPSPITASRLLKLPRLSFAQALLTLWLSTLLPLLFREAKLKARWVIPTSALTQDLCLRL